MCLKLFLSNALAIVMLLGAGNAVSAQSAQNNEEGQSYMFHVMYLSDTLDKREGENVMPGINLKFQTDGEVYSVGAVRNSLTRGFRFDGSNILTFFKEEPDGEGGMFRKPLAQVNLGQPGTKLIVMAKTGDDKYSAYALNIGGAGFKRNHFRVLNFSNQVVYAQVGERKRQVGPSQSQDFKVSGDNYRFVVQVGLAAVAEEKPYVFAKKRMSMKEGGRKLLVVHNSQKKPGRLTYKEFHIPNTKLVKKNVSDKELKELDTSIYEEFGDDLEPE